MYFIINAYLKLIIRTYKMNGWNERTNDYYERINSQNISKSLKIQHLKLQKKLFKNIINLTIYVFLKDDFMLK